jgi:tetratricopeptide (TPR) repeat protein
LFAGSARASDESEQLLEQLRASPDDAALQFACGRHFGKLASQANVFSAYGYAKRSLKCLEAAVDLDPDNLDYRVGLINFYVNAPSIVGGSQAGAREQIRQLAILDPLFGARMELLHLRQNDSAVELTQFIDAQPEHIQNDPAFLYQKGRLTVLTQRDIKHGIVALEGYIARVATMNTTRDDLAPIEWAHLRLAQLFVMNHQLHEANKHFGLAATSNDPELQQLLQEVRSTAIVNSP